MSPSIPQALADAPRLPGGARRVVGPIPPRDAKGRLKLAPVPGKKVKVNQLGEPVRDERGNVIEIDTDLRDEREFYAYEVGHEKQIADGATKGLHLYQVDLPPEPLVLVYAKSMDEAVKVFQREQGITRFGERDPKVTLVSAV